VLCFLFACGYFQGEKSQGIIYNFFIFMVLLLTLLFANFAEAIAEARGKAQADSLRKTREETPAKKITAL
jgi:K+-transporting ATPase ATPase B chain